MKKSTLTVLAIVAILVIAGIMVFGRKGDDIHPANNDGNTQTTNNNGNTQSTPVVPVSETTKVSSKLSAYENDELGFTIKYPSDWEKTETNTGVTFIMPIDKTQVSTIATLKVDITAVPGKCGFPPVTTIKDRGTITVAGMDTSMISMSNSVQGRTYFNRMYNLQKADICYSFAFAAIAQSTSYKNLTGSNATQATNNNKAIINTADAAFTEMVKSFSFVVPPTGVDETKAAPAKK